jgi:dTDP-4-amino-4,6-dideoxygalactose transaminase
MINVTKSYLPPIEEYTKYLERIWESSQLTNNGPLVLELEEKLKAYLGVKHFFFVSNGTIALQLAIKALDLKGEVITTPFSYVATTSSIVWEGCKPIFTDIEPETFCIDPVLIEKAITPKTSAILATHVYGYPCEVEKIQVIAEKNNLGVIYDAAHTFGVKYKGKSLASFGDVATLSFHATKVFHTGEGGAVVTNNDEIAHKVAYMRNFGHKGLEEFYGLGINGKNSELHAAMGLCIFPKLPEIIKRRKEVSSIYDRLLKDSTISRPICPNGTDYNYAYYPVIFPSEEKLLLALNALKEKEIYPRRYFYPSLTTLPYLDISTALISDNLSKRIMCLPLSTYLEEDEISLISQILIKSQLD